MRILFIVLLTGIFCANIYAATDVKKEEAGRKKQDLSFELVLAKLDSQIKGWLSSLIAAKTNQNLHQTTTARSSEDKMTVNSGNLEFKKGKNKFTAEVGSDYRKNLRIYGINDVEQQEWSPLAYATYILVASPFTGNTEGCERNDAQSSARLNAIVESKDVIKKINQLKAMRGRTRATLIGKNIAVKRFYFEGKDHSDSLQPQGQFDPRRAILITDIVDMGE